MNTNFELNFNKNKFDCIICLNSDLPTRCEIDLFGSIPILAADGAANRLLELGITPDYIVGDLDSIKISDKISNFDKNKLFVFPDQNSCDFEKIIEFAKKMNYYTCLMIGFHGGDLEHTLNNWSVLTKIGNSINICILDKQRYCLPIYNSLSLAVKPGETISIIPSPKAKLATLGLKWELNSEYLELGIREGARNEAVNSSVQLDLIEGSYLLTLDARAPFSPEFRAIE